jgi:energy-coupling factor transporter ATP-binding protein EcfA2
MRRQQLPQPEKPPERAEEEPSPKKPTKKPKGDRKLHEKAATVPHNPVNEMVVIATALVSPTERKKLVRLFTSDFFYAPGHSHIWNVIEELDRKNLNYDPATIEQLSNDEVDTNYLDDLIRERPEVSPNLRHHIDQMYLDRERMTLVPVFNELLDGLHEPTTDREELRRQCRRMANWFDGSGTSRFLRSAEDVQIEMERELDADIARHRDGCGIYPYGIEGLDYLPNGKPRVVPGAAPGGSTLVVGASGSGKTTVANQMVLSFTEQKRVTLHGGWEVKEARNLRMFAGFSLGLSRTKIWTGDLTDEEAAEVKAEARRIWNGDHPLLKFMVRPFDRETSKSQKKERRYGNDYNLDSIHEHIEASGADVAIFDLFHKALVEMKPDDEKRALDRIQGIAEATKCHIVLLHHVNKEDMEKSPGHLPTRKAIKGSSAWLDSVDTVLATHSPAMWKRIPNDKLEILILKQRYAMGRDNYRIEFDYDADTGLIRNGREVDAGFDDEESLDDSIGSALNEGRTRR